MEDIIGWGFIALVFSGMGGCVYSLNTPTAIAEREAREAECAKPKLITSAGDVELWAHNWCEQHPVYFSKSGTKWTRTERVGKTSRTVDEATPNAEINL